MLSPRSWFWKILLGMAVCFALWDVWIALRLSRPPSVVSSAESSVSPANEISGDEEKSPEAISPMPYLVIGGKDPFHLEKVVDVPAPPKEDAMADAVPVEPISLAGLSLKGTMLKSDGKHLAIINSGAQEKTYVLDDEVQGLKLAKVAKDYVTLTKGTQSGTLKIQIEAAGSAGAQPGAGPVPPGPSGPSGPFPGNANPNAPPGSAVPGRPPGLGLLPGKRPGPQPAKMPAEVSPTPIPGNASSGEGPGGLSPEMMASLKHRPANDWSGVRLRMDYFTPDQGETRVLSVARGSPAFAAGIKPGDTIQSINGTRPGSLEQAFELLQRTSSGSGVAVAVERGGFSTTVQVARPLEANP